MEPQFAPARGGGGGGGDADAEEMQRMWQFLDSALPTPPTAAHPPPAPEDAPPEPEDDAGMYSELGDVFNNLLFFGMEDSPPGAAKFSEPGAGAGASEVVGPADAPPAAADAAAAAAAHKVQLPRSASASSSHSGVDSISPLGMLGYPSMSPATINLLQSLATSASSESLTGLISPAALYGGGGGGSAGAAALAAATDGGKGSALPRSPSCEMIDWKAYNEAAAVAERAQKEPAKWRVIPQHGPHADPAAPGAAAAAAAISSFPGSAAGPSPERLHATARAEELMASDGAVGADGGLRTHLTRQFETIKSTVVSIVGALGPPEGGAPPGAPLARPLSTQEQAQQVQQAARRAAEEKNKRKAIISPEYVQYGNAGGGGGGGGALVNPALFGADAGVVKLEGGLGQLQFATEVPDPTGRRPSKRSLHQAAPAPPPPVGSVPAPAVASDADAAAREEESNPAAVRCKCTGKCRNARCACVKAGRVCGAQCKCVSCANPFVPMEREGIDIARMAQDVCLMQHLSKVKDMQELLDSTVAYECCDGVVQVKHAVESGFTCPHCQAHYTYSWCSHKLCHDQKRPRKHCAKCRRCGDHRNEHCDRCNHCYFAGVANSFRCSCTSGKPATGSGVKARSVAPADGAKRLDAPPPDLFGARDENADGANLPAGGGAGTTPGAPGPGAIASGLSGPDGEADDGCKTQ